MQRNMRSLTCEFCGRAFTARPISTNGKPRRFCSRQCAYDGLRRAEVRQRYRYRGNKREHRLVMEQILGRPLSRNEIVHHKDGNGHNNSPENLEVLTQAEHMQHHQGARPMYATCHRCSGSIRLKYYQRNRFRKNPNRRFFHKECYYREQP